MAFFLFFCWPYFCFEYTNSRALIIWMTENTSEDENIQSIAPTAHYLIKQGLDPVTLVNNKFKIMSVTGICLPSLSSLHQRSFYDIDPLCYLDVHHWTHSRILHPPPLGGNALTTQAVGQSPDEAVMWPKTSGWEVCFLEFSCNLSV